MKLGGGKEWFTAAELAELALPGLPRDKRPINARAKAEHWADRAAPDGVPLARKRNGTRGGGLEYHVLALPASCRSALVAQGIRTIADVREEPESRRVALWAWFDSQNDGVKAEAQRRLTILGAVRLYEQAGMTTTAAVATVAARERVSPATIWSWRDLVAGVPTSDRLPTLAPRRAGGGKQAEIDDDAWQVFVSDYLRLSRPSMSECYRRTQKWAEQAGISIPHLRTFRRRIERDIPPAVIVLRREGAEEMRRMLPAQQRTVADLHALEAVNIDGHKFDVFVRYPDGEIRRPLMVAIQDVHSRKMLAWRLAESENAIATRQCFANLFRDYGIPKHCVLDNARAFASKWITGGAKSRFRFKIKDDEPLGLLTALGIEIHWATPYRGQSKPIERAFLDLTDIIARHPLTEGAYTGNNPTAKPENYATAAVPLEVFERLVESGIAAHSARVGRATEMCQGKLSFDQVFDASYAVSPIGKASPEQMRMALLTAEQRRCNKQTAEITLDGNRYWSEALYPWAGQKLTIRFDPDNLHSEIHVYDPKGVFIATAPVIERSGFLDKAAAAARGKQEAEWRRTVRAADKAQDLLSIAALTGMLGDGPAAPPLATPTVVRAVRHRGQTAAALKALPDIETEAAPLTQSRDRLTNAMERLRRVK